MLFTRSPLRHRAYLRLWLGLTVSRLGDQFTVIALLWFVLQLTKSGAAVGLAILCFELPGVVTGPILGHLLDRFQPRILMGIDNLLRAVVIALLPTLFAFDVLAMWQVYLLALCAGALSPTTVVGERVMVPHLVPDAELEQANALSSVNVQFAALVGPLSAGLLVAAAGAQTALVVDAASFVVMGVVALTLPDVRRESHGVDTPAQRARQEGHPRRFGVIFTMKEVRALTLLAFVFFFSYGPLEAALPVYSKVTLHSNAVGYGLLWTGFGIGALVGAVGTGLVARRRRPGILLAGIAVLWGALLSPLAFLQVLPPAMLFLGLAGCAWAPYTAVETSLLQRLIPQQMRGEVFGERATITTAAAPLGAALGGVLLGTLSASAIIGLSAFACVVSGALGLVSPTLRNLRRREGAADSAFAPMLDSV